MSTKVGELRETLMECIEKVKAKQMDAADATAVAKLAAQISLSLQVEANVRLEGLRGEKLPLGQLAIGDETPIAERAK